jgi:hypothetical protein
MPVRVVDVVMMAQPTLACRVVTVMRRCEPLPVLRCAACRRGDGDALDAGVAVARRCPLRWSER